MSLLTCGYRIRTESRLDTLIFSLNPGFWMDSITSERRELKLFEKRTASSCCACIRTGAGRNNHFYIYYTGIPDESVAYLDIPREQMDAFKRIMVAPIDKKPGIIHPDYMLLTPELNWYPVAGVGFNLETFQPREPDFCRFSLTVRTDSSLTAIAPG